MYISEVIKRVDELYPNPYSKQQKLDWCYELTAQLTAEVIKTYSELTFKNYSELEDFANLDITFEDIDSLYVDGVEYDKIDLRTFETFPKDFKEVRVACRDRAAPYRDIEYSGEYNFTQNSILIPENKLKTGDNILVAVDGADYDLNVLEKQGESVIVKDGAFSFAGNRKAKIKLKTYDLTACPAPYNAMYIDFVLSKIAFYQNDPEEYNKHTSAFNAKLLDYSHYYKETAPLNIKGFKNKW